MEASNDFFLRKGLSSPEGLYHLSQTFTLVKGKLESDEALSDSTMSIVVMLIIQEQMRKGKWEAQVHYQGLLKMIELRGGLSQLEKNLPLLLKICKQVTRPHTPYYLETILILATRRMDITYSLQFGGPLHFFRDYMYETLVILESKGFEVKRDLITCGTRFEGLDPSLYDILLDVNVIANLFNNLPADQTMDTYLFQELVISVCFRLLKFRPAQGFSEKHNTEAALHIGLMVFMMTLFLQHNYRHFIDYDLVTLRLKDTLNLHLHELDDDLGLWLVFIGRAWTWGDNDEFWAGKIGEVVHRLGITHEADVLMSVKAFPWINALHDKLSHMVWASVYGDPSARQGNC
jgi:hypothetical protein